MRYENGTGDPRAVFLSDTAPILSANSVRVVAARFLRTAGALLLLSLAACGPAAAPDRLRAIGNGQQLYQQHCARCHGDRGQGLAQLYPPLAGADYLRLHAEALPCIISQGLADTLVVNGTVYSLAMPGNPELYPREIAQIATFVLSAWGNDTLFAEPPYLTPDSVERALDRCR
ncbi:MAG: cytochrome c [Bacteroidia bacterium]|nr:cytochrome c [Bacteroidia bacterium]